MRTKDHLALGRYLLSQFGGAGLRRYKYAFLLGCIEPDYNWATYARGMKAYQKFRGHNADNSLSLVEKRLDGFQDQGLCGVRDYFRLGTVLHYVADAFTWPHNRFWPGDLLQHALYERQLHHVFGQTLRTTAAAQTTDTELLALTDWFAGRHADYSAAPRQMQTDCQYIISVCADMLLGCLRYVAEPVKEKFYWNEVWSYESAYQH